ncbi:NADPH-dependent FMN reductase [uncultured Friedmanniella sp.]|uniref:NADPH-dependent FMN reductase n=1 Tax=uncultured Friedmanniella sp. TaxID=335381 RepID=UPI0035CA6E5E
MVTDPGAATVVALSGNPRAGSRTSLVARAVAERVAGLAGSAEIVAVELADLAPYLFAAERPGVDATLTTVAASTVLVVATPVYKASYTGLLKSFLDLYGTNGLAGVTAVPVVVSGSPAHSLAGEVHLRPLLVELGASVPTRALAVTESQLAQLDDVVDRWFVTAAPLLRPAFARSGGPPADPETEGRP